jgi:hypothetical protein
MFPSVETLVEARSSATCAFFESLNAKIAAQQSGTGSSGANAEKEERPQAAYPINWSISPF